MPSIHSFERPLLVLAHPGHEIGVYGFLGRFRCPVMAWTDGSGRRRWPRAAASRQLVEHAGAEAFEPFGIVPDGELFRAMLEGDPKPFVEWFDCVKFRLAGSDITDVVTEAAEGFNPIADALRWIVAAAAESVGGVKVWEWPVVGPPVSVVPMGGHAFDLTEFEFHRKLNAAHGCIDLAPEVDDAIHRHGLSRFRREVLTPALGWCSPPDALTPHRYEEHGERLAAGGHVKQAIRYADHVKPLLNTIEVRAFGSAA
jgi:hypothetical protein